MRSFLSAVLAVVLAASASAQIVGIEEAFPGLRFDKPVGVRTAPGLDDRFFVVEQGDNAAQPDLPARVLTLAPGDAEPTVYLDLYDRVGAFGGETGLLGLAFHPDYEANGRVFVHYTAPTDVRIPGQRVFISRISEFARDETDPLTADPESERILLEVDQPEGNHNGGDIDFGPDGYLYIALGDGGGAGDPFDQGQDPTTLLAAILRIDVDDVAEGEAYGIPDDNPFAQTDGPERDEIFAYGLRNPFKIDPSRHGLWVGDVGQNEWEEVNLVVSGGNYGWNEVEGPDCYPQNSSCNQSLYEAPVVSYPHRFSTGGFSITGGYVLPTVGDGALSDHYVYGDFVTGRMWAILATEEADPFVILEPGQGGAPTLGISSIDPDPFSFDILVTDYFAGRIYRLRLGSTPAEAAPERAALAVSLAGPTPFRTTTAVRIDSQEPVRVSIVDVRGREVALLWDGPSPGVLDIDGARLAPGAYAIRAVAASGTATAWVVRAR